jgi:hypothetical protein
MFDRDLADVFVLQDEVVGRIVTFRCAAIGAAISPSSTALSTDSILSISVIGAKRAVASFPGPGIQADAPALDVGDDPVPVVLDLMHPCLVSGRRGRGANELRSDAHRHG